MSDTGRAAHRRRGIVVARNAVKTPRLRFILPIVAAAALMAGNARADGTLHDPLDNTDTFDNAEEYNGDIASNTGNISNNEPGVWTGAVSNGTGSVTNSWIWNGDVASNAGSITNNADAVWTGDVTTNDSQLWNGGTWNGDVLGNSNIIYTLEGSTWTGNVVAQTDGTVFNMGTWTGDVETNNGYVYQWGGAWVGDVLSNDRDILVVAGTWTGDVVTNAGSLVNRAAWTGDVLANTGTVENDAGGIWKGDVTNGTGTLHNYGSWTGNVKGNLGSFYNDGADALWTGDVMGSDSQIMNENGATWNGDVKGNNNAIFNEAGSTWNGDVIANGGGSNALALIDNYGTWNGDVKGNAVTVYNDFAWTGDVTGNAGKVINYTGVWTGDVTGNTGTVSNRSGVTWDGDVTGNDGTVENRLGGTWNGSVLANDGIVTNKGVWNGAFTNAGTVNAENRINGAFDNTGTLNLTGSLAGIATLTNSGTVNLRGNGAAQTLSAANALFGPHSIYALDVDAAGNSDLIAVTGTAALNGSVRVAAATGTPYNASTVYTILTAGTVTGTFKSVTTDLIFLAPRLSYETDAVTLTLLRNDTGFATVGTSRNQRATGRGVETLGAGNAIYDAVLWLNAGQAGHAFDSLSGEAFSSVDGANVQNASLLSDILSARIDQIFNVPGFGPQAFEAPRNADPIVSAYAGEPAPVAASGRDIQVWGQVYGGQGSVGTTGDNAGMDTTTGGFAGGVDGLAGDWRLGVMANIGASRNVLAGLNSSANSTDYGAGIYGGREWGRTRLSLGAIYTRHDISSDRHVSFLGFTDTESADYSAGTAQVFGKLSQAYKLEPVTLTPYASLAYVHNDTDGFSETGGPAALTSDDSQLDATITTLGLEAGRSFRLGETLLTTRARLGWRHTFADTPSSVHRFSSGGDFTVDGAPIDGDAIVAGAGLDIDATSSLDISYEGRVGGSAGGHALMASWAMAF